MAFKYSFQSNSLYKYITLTYATITIIHMKSQVYDQWMINVWFIYPLCKIDILFIIFICIKMLIILRSLLQGCIWYFMLIGKFGFVRFVCLVKFNHFLCWRDVKMNRMVKEYFLYMQALSCIEDFHNQC